MRTFDKTTTRPQRAKSRSPTPATAKSATSAKTAASATSSQGFDLSRVPATSAADASNAPSTLADWLPQAHGATAARARVHPASALADREGANAVTVGTAVHLATNLPREDVREQKRVLAHELVHVAQHFATGPAAPSSALEAEAHALAPRVLEGRAPQPRLHASGTVALADKRGQSPKDKLDVERAKQRRDVLLRQKALLEAKLAQLTSERQGVRKQRMNLDDSMQKVIDSLDQGVDLGVIASRPPRIADYRAAERRMLDAMNRTPMTVEVTERAVRIRARFQARFEGRTDKEARALFPTLEKNFRKGVADTWNQTLKGDVFGGRTFEMIPEITLVPATAKRDANSWLITVRPTDKAPMKHAGVSLGTAPGGIPTSATDPSVDGGVMSIPPSHIKLADTLGHETLHVFGLVDRYVWMAELPATDKPGDLPMRDTKGRKDPLGSQGGTILAEDLGFVFDEFGVYDKEASRFPSLVAGMSHSQILAEIMRVDEIIKLGRDPNSMVRERGNFNREMVKQTEDLD